MTIPTSPNEVDTLSHGKTATHPPPPLAQNHDTVSPSQPQHNNSPPIVDECMQSSSVAANHAHTGSVSDPTDLIPESLLSLAKDARYIQQCQTLIRQLFEPFLLHLGGRPSSSQLEKDSWFLSSLLYLLLVIIPNRGRTIGMDTVGLRFSGTVATFQRKELISGVLLVSILGIYKLKRLFHTSTITPSRMVEGDGNFQTSNTGSNSNREAVRGAARRQIHEVLRQQMIQRSEPQTVRRQNNPFVRLDLEGGNDANQVATPMPSFQRRLLTSLFRLGQSTVEMFSGGPLEGPHTIARRNDTNTVDTGLTTQQQESPPTISLGMWVLRLHLAQYCITGKYPTWFHRLARLSLEKVLTDKNCPPAATTTTSHPIPCRPTMHRAVGLLIGIQAGATLLRYMFNWYARWLAGRIVDEQRMLTSERKLPRTIASSLFPSTTTTDSQDVAPGAGATSCAICRTERSHPAAPSSCGHIFCWNCLIQWVSTVRPECPLCRSPCRPQDVIPLYNYMPQLVEE